MCKIESRTLRQAAFCWAPFTRCAPPTAAAADRPLPASAPRASAARPARGLVWLWRSHTGRLALAQTLHAYMIISHSRAHQLRLAHAGCEKGHRIPVPLLLSAKCVMDCFLLCGQGYFENGKKKTINVQATSLKLIFIFV
jgi:hypothetical protein